MKLELSEALASPYVSGTQRARAWTEGWLAEQAFCPSCGHESLRPFRNNEPGRDFFCIGCQEDFQLKSTKSRFGRKLTDGAYGILSAQIQDSRHPNFLFLRYDLKGQKVTDLLAVPKQFISLASVEQRRPLGPAARRAGWIGCNILLHQIPADGQLFIVQDSVVRSREAVLENWRKTLFLREKSALQRGWLIDVMLCVEHIGRLEFDLADVYRFEPHLAALYPGNNNVRPKIRQQLQVLRDNGRMAFLGNGRYRLLP